MPALRSWVGVLAISAGAFALASCEKEATDDGSEAGSGATGGSGAAGRGTGGTMAGSGGGGRSGGGGSAGGSGVGTGGTSLGGSAGAATAGTAGSRAGASGSTDSGGAPAAGTGGNATAGSDDAGGEGAVAGESNAAGTGGSGATNDYDAAVLADHPVAYFAMSGTSTESDLSGHGHVGRYEGGAPDAATLPNGDRAADFDGDGQYLTIPSHESFSIPTTGVLTWEAWIRPDTLEHPNDSGGYVDWLGKCEEYAPTCEWEGRMYRESSERCSRMSAYAFNPGADLGSGAFWQADCGTIEAGSWYHIVGQYTLLDQPDGCDNADQYPGAIEIWVNGVNWNQSSHGQTGCMSQYDVAPEANDSAVNVGTMARDTWFSGAVGKVAIYDVLLDAEQIARHYEVMTGKAPTGSCDGTCSF